jgi:hypothetical protein
LVLLDEGGGKAVGGVAALELGGLAAGGADAGSAGVGAGADFGPGACGCPSPIWDAGFAVDWGGACI